MALPHGFVNTFLCEDGSFLIILNILHETAHKIRHLSYDTLFKQHAVHIPFVEPQRKKRVGPFEKDPLPRCFHIELWKTARKHITLYSSILRSRPYTAVQCSYKLVFPRFPCPGSVSIGKMPPFSTIINKPCGNHTVIQNAPVFRCFLIAGKIPVLLQISGIRPGGKIIKTRPHGKRYTIPAEGQIHRAPRCMGSGAAISILGSATN